jgi:hypothetical protein
MTSGPTAPEAMPTTPGAAPTAPGATPTGTTPGSPVPGGTSTGAPPTGTPPASSCANPGSNTGASVMRRLSGLEYQLTLQDLFALSSPPSLEGIPPDNDKDGFKTFAEVQTISAQHVRAYLDNAHELAGALMADSARSAKVIGCAPSATDCLATFTARFGRLAYRRALSAEEVTALTTRAAADALDATDQFRFVIEALLSSPNFLYRVEIGEMPEGLSPLKPEELASRLSFALWGRAPSAELLDQAAEGALSTPLGLSQVAASMLSDARAQLFFNGFFRQWLGFETLRAPNVPPAGWEASLMPLMQEETEQVIARIAWSGQNFLDVLTTNQTRASAPLAKYFGLPAPAADGSVTFPVGHPRENTGVLTHPSLLSMKTDGDPIAIRGNWLRKTFLCSKLEIPPDLADLIGDRLVGLDPYQIVQTRNTEETCKGCHAQIDPVGVGFAAFDSTGRFDETVDVGRYGVAAALPDAPVPAFKNLGELAAKLRELPRVTACMADKAFLYVNGHEATTDDLCSIDSATRAFAAGNHSFTALVKGLIEAPEFRLRRAPATP